MNNNILISIIIVNYDTNFYLEDCLKSLLKFFPKIPYEIIVVDNNSENRSIENFPDKFSDVKFIFLSRNNGFGSGCNIGIKTAIGKYVVFVNPDIIFTENVFYPLLELMEENDDIAVSTGVLQDMENNLIYTYNKFPGFVWELKEALGKGSQKTIDNLLKRKCIINRVNTPFYVDWVIGAFMFFRATVIKELKGFDEDFFLYYEDMEIQRRVYNMGYKIAILPCVRICHLQRASVKSFNGENLYYFHMMRSKYIYFYKHSGFIFILITKIMHTAGILMRTAILPIRMGFKGKKMQKLYQYKFMIKIIFSGHKKLLKLSMNDIPKYKYSNSDELIKDKFWK